MKVLAVPANKENGKICHNKLASINYEAIKYYILTVSMSQKNLSDAVTSQAISPIKRFLSIILNLFTINFSLNDRERLL